MSELQQMIFGGDTGDSYEAMKRKRALSEQLASNATRTPQNFGQGLSTIGQALAARRLGRQSDAMDQRMRGEFNEKFAQAAPNTQGLVDLAESPYAGRAHQSVLQSLLAGVPNYQRGTNYHPGGKAVVGERGPEVVDLPRGSQVQPLAGGIQPPPPEAFEAPPEGYDPHEMLGGGQGDLGMLGQAADDNLRYGNEKLTQDQSKSLTYYRRGFGSNQTLNDPRMAEALTQYTDSFAGNFGAIGRAFQDADYQVANRAASEFLAAILRKDTGAAITSQEFDLYGPMYLPQPGDKPELLAAKARAREEALIAIEMGLGTAAPLAGIARDELNAAQEPEDLTQLSDEDILKRLTGGN